MKFTLLLLVAVALAASALADQHDKNDKDHAKEHPNEKHSKNDGHGHKRSVRSLGLAPALAYAPAPYAAYAHAPYAPAYARAPAYGLAYYG
ncbi:hypothetical protein R5R35_011224 [Gryllus longicercus]|uniref:Accessory gland protein n=1 Tax=Gryllus longicercus TaxID=2509291 RepID=A0AAN9Z0N3_9ORTH